MLTTILGAAAALLATSLASQSAAPDVMGFDTGGSTGRLSLPPGFCVATGPYKDFGDLFTKAAPTAIVLNMAMRCDVMREGGFPTDILVMATTTQLANTPVPSRAAILNALRAMPKTAIPTVQDTQAKVGAQINEIYGPSAKVAENDRRFEVQGQCAYLSEEAQLTMVSVKMNAVIALGMTTVNHRMVMLEYVKYSLLPISDRAPIVAFTKTQCERLTTENGG
jgi:hypothetical protein